MDSEMSDTYIVPRVDFVEGGIHKSADPYSYLLSQRVVYLPTSVNELSANAIVAQLLALSHQDPDADIAFYINSGGGSVTAGLAIYDAIRSISAKVNTICLGQCCSMGAFLLMGGTGKRLATQNSRIMIHQTSGGFSGTNASVQIHAIEMGRLNALLMDIMAKNSKMSIDEMKSACLIDTFLTPTEAMNLGIIDSVLPSPHD